ncbi:MAG TPA: hypothetical protein VIV55_02070 [Flavobacterium sp.]
MTLVLLLILLIRVYFLISNSASKARRNHKTPKYAYEIFSDTNNFYTGTKKKLVEERKEIEDFYKDAEFVNKNCTRLEDFIINDEMNSFDLRKLADLNNIRLQIPEAWYPITIELIKELNTNGWDKKVSCIKEKFATLEFYTSHNYEDTISKIIRYYEHKSHITCQTCGEKGEVRNYLGWYYVICRKHYLENRGKITVENTGFNYEGNFYEWTDIKDRSFKDLDFNGNYKSIVIEFNKTQVQHPVRSDNKLYLSIQTIGFGNLLNYLSKNFYSPRHSYIRNYEKVEFCEICGYQSVYFGKCECCENETWEALTEALKRSKKEENSEENNEEYKFEYNKNNQIVWTLDEGELFESQQKNYIKNPNYKILFNEAELKEYVEQKEYTDQEYFDDGC